jgi:hypothetical protein
MVSLAPEHHHQHNKRHPHRGRRRKQPSFQLLRLEGDSLGTVTMKWRSKKHNA